MTTQNFAINTEPVLLIAPIGPFRDALRKSLKGIGFVDVKTVNTVQDAIHHLEVEENLPFWIVTTPALNESVNALQLLRLVVENEELRHINVSFFFDSSDDHCIPTAFELGLLSAHRVVGRVITEIDKELKTLVTRASAQSYDMCLLSSIYLREFLTEQRSFASLLDFERGMARMYPKSAEQLLAVAEVLLRLERRDDARSCLLQARQMRPAIGAQAVALYQKFLGPAAAAEKPLDGDNIAEMFAVRSALVVDADADSQTALEKALVAMGINQVHKFGDSDSAIAWVTKSNEPGIVVMEWKLTGGLSGPAFLQRLRQRGWFNAPVIVASSLVNAGHKQLLRELGVAMITEKPLAQTEFVKNLAATLRANFFPANFKAMMRQIDELLCKEQLAPARRIADQLFASRDKLPVEVQDFLEAKISYAEERYEVAHRLMVKLARLEPDNLAFHDLLGKILLRMGEFEAAVMCFKRADSVAPDNIERICSMAEAYSELGDFDLAEEHIGTVKALDPDNSQVQAAEVKVGVLSKNFEAAKAAFANMSDPNVLLAYMNNRAVAFARSGRHDQGIGLYADTLKIVPESKRGIQGILYYNLGLAHIRKGDLPGALPYLTEAGLRSSGKVKNKVDKIMSRVEAAIGSGSTFTIDTPGVKVDTPREAIDAKAAPGEARCHGIFVAAANANSSRVSIESPRYRKRATIRRGSTNPKKASYA